MQLDTGDPPPPQLIFKFFINQLFSFDSCRQSQPELLKFCFDTNVYFETFLYSPVVLHGSPSGFNENVFHLFFILWFEPEILTHCFFYKSGFFCRRSFASQVFLSALLRVAISTRWKRRKLRFSKTLLTFFVCFFVSMWTCSLPLSVALTYYTHTSATRLKNWLFFFFLLLRFIHSNLPTENSGITTRRRHFVLQGRVGTKPAWNHGNQTLKEEGRRDRKPLMDGRYGWIVFVQQQDTRLAKEQ